MREYTKHVARPLFQAGDIVTVNRYQPPIYAGSPGKVEGYRQVGDKYIYQVSALEYKATAFVREEDLSWSHG